MKKLIAIIPMMLLILIVGCDSPHSIDREELDKHEVKQTTDETTQDDFIFRLVSEKEQYKEGEKVTLYGELEYVGEKPEITIHHSSSVFQFLLEEKMRDYSIVRGVRDIGKSTTLKRGEIYREKYKKSEVFNFDEHSEEYENFLDDFLSREGFLMGYYVVKGYADFSPELENGGGEIMKIEAMIDFKVVE